MNAPYFKFSESDSGFYFKFCDVDQTMKGHGEHYTSKQGRLNGVQAVRENCTDINNYDLRVTKDGKLYFVLQAGNNEIVYTSKFFHNENERQAGIAQLMKFGPVAETLE